MAKIIFGPFLNHPVAPFSVAFNTKNIIYYYDTTKPNSSVSSVQDRMPLIVDRSHEDSNMKDVMKALVLDNYLTETEIKEAYRSYVDKLEEDSK